MTTFLLAGIIFLGVGLVIYHHVIKKDASCDCSTVDCPIKNKKPEEN